jgi:hypothetical protein
MKIMERIVEGFFDWMFNNFYWFLGMIGACFIILLICWKG